MNNTFDILTVMLANLGIFFIFVTLLARFFPSEALLESKKPTIILYSIFFVILSLVVMQFPIASETGNRIDLRNVPVFVAGIMGGLVPGLVVGTIVGLYRLILGGTGMEIGALQCLVAGLSAGLYSKYFLRGKLTGFNSLHSLIPVIIAFAIYVPIVLFFNGNSSLWPSRLWSFLFQLLGTLALTVILQDALKMAENTASLKKDVVTDKVTKTYNIRFLDTYLNKHLDKAKKSGGKVTVVFLDIDYFKTINDTYGHQKGDEILFKIAQTIQSSIRPSDVVGRYGGDEFLIILPGCDSVEAINIAQRVKDKITLLQDAENLGNTLSVSMGIATYPTHGINSESLIKNADNALYTAKNSGRNKLIIAS